MTNDTPGMGPMQQHPVDPANPLLQPTPSTMLCTVLDTPNGQLLLLTIRTTDVTLTVHLDADAAFEWAKVLGNTSSGMSRLVVARGQLPPPPPGPGAPWGPLNGRPHP